MDNAIVLRLYEAYGGKASTVLKTTHNISRVWRYGIFFCKLTCLGYILACFTIKWHAIKTAPVICTSRKVIKENYPLQFQKGISPA